MIKNRRINSIIAVMSDSAVPFFFIEDFRLDVAWSDSQGVTHAFEVQHRGGLEHALVNLLSALQHFECVPVLAVSRASDVTHAHRLVHKKLAPFADLAEALVVVDMADVFLLSQWMRARDEQVKDLLERLSIHEPH